MRKDYIWVHHSASGLWTTAQDISRWHTLPPPAGRGWRLGTGYQRVIEADGQVYDGRKLQQRGAHTKGWNTNSIGICVVGNNLVPGEGWTSEEETALLDTLIYFRKMFPNIKVGGHRDAPGARTECPGLNIYLP